MSSSKEEMARREGMSYAFRYAKEHGLDGLEKELKYRGAYEIPLKISIMIYRNSQILPKI